MRCIVLRPWQVTSPCRKQYCDPPGHCIAPDGSLELDTVLNEVVESARARTGAAYSVIATVDEAGEPSDFVTSGFARRAPGDGGLAGRAPAVRPPARARDAVWSFSRSPRPTACGAAPPARSSAASLRRPGSARIRSTSRCTSSAMAPASWCAMRRSTIAGSAATGSCSIRSTAPPATVLAASRCGLNDAARRNRWETDLK